MAKAGILTKKNDAIEIERRVRIVEEWIIEDVPYTEIINRVMKRWKCADRTAKRYIKDARERWSEEAQESIDQKRHRKIIYLQRLRNSLQRKYKGTPDGIKAQLLVDREINKLSAIIPPQQLAIGGMKDGPPIQHAVHKITHNLVVQKSEE